MEQSIYYLLHVIKSSRLSLLSCQQGDDASYHLPMILIGECSSEISVFQAISRIKSGSPLLYILKQEKNSTSHIFKMICISFFSEKIEKINILTSSRFHFCLSDNIIPFSHSQISILFDERSVLSLLCCVGSRSCGICTSDDDDSR